MMDKIYMWLAWRCPRGLVYWCVIRGLSEVSSHGDSSSGHVTSTGVTPVSQITGFDILDAMTK